MDVLKAIRECNFNKLDKKLKKGFDPNKEVLEKINGRSVYTIPICLAAARRYMGMVEILLIHGADIHKYNSDWASPLHTATFHGFPEIIALLIEYNVDINRQDIHGDTALNLAIKKEHTQAVELLLKANADIEISNKDGENALNLIEHVTSTAIYQMVREYNRKKESQYEQVDNLQNNNSEENEEIDEKEKLRKKLKELEMQEKNEIIEKKMKEVNELEKEISDGLEENHTLQKQINRLQEKLTKNTNSLTLKESRKQQLEREIKKLQGQKNVTNGLNKDEMEGGLECPICFILPLPPRQVFQCKNGHILCDECQKKIDQCPICRITLSRTDPIRNRAFEEIIAGMYVTQSNF